MITIFVNGNLHTIEPTTTLEILLLQLELQGKRIAVELNHEIIPRSVFARTQLRKDDRVEIVHAIGGG